MTAVTFDPTKASPMRWIVDSIERALLGVTTASGAAHSFAVALGVDRVRVPDADSQETDPALVAPGRVIGEAAAMQRGYAVCHVAHGPSEINLPLSDPAQFYEMRVAVTIALPAPAFWPARARAEDLIDRVCNDCCLAVMADRRRTVSGTPLAESCWIESSHEAMEHVESQDIEAALCVFALKHRRRHLDPQHFAPGGLALLGEPIDAFTIHADGPLAAAFLESEQGVVRLTHTPIGAETAELRFSLAGRTIAELAADLGAVAGVTAGTVNADVASLPAADLLPFASQSIQGAGSALAFELEA